MNRHLQLLYKDITLELRRASVMAGLGLYLLSTVFICYLTVGLRQNQITPLVWSSLFWITVLFTAINAAAKSFFNEKRGADTYLYTLASAHEIIVSKIAYNFLLISLFSFCGYLLFATLLQNPIQDNLIFISILFLGSLGFAVSFTVLSGIASKANNSSILMAVLSFPIIIALLLVLVRVTKNCIDGLGWDASADDLLQLAAIDSLVGGVAYLIFPFVWRS